MLKKILLTCTMGAMLLGASVCAAEFDYAVSDVASGKLTVSGTLPYSARQPWVAVTVLNPGYTEADSKDAVNCMKQTVLSPISGSDEGSFSVNIQINNPVEDNYVVKVNYYGAEAKLEKNISYLSPSGLGDVCADIVSAINSQNLADLKSELSAQDVMNFLGVRQDIIAGATFEEVCADIISNSADISVSANPESVRRTYEERASLIIIKSGNGSDYIKSLTGTKGEIVKDVLKGTYNDETAYEVYEKASEKVQNAVAAAVGGKSYKNGEKFNEAFSFEVLRKSIQNASNYLDIRKVMTDYKDVFATSWSSAYNKLSADGKAAAETALKSAISGANSIDDIGNAFSDCIDAQMVSGSKPGSGIGGGSSGGGGGGGRGTSGGAVSNVQVGTGLNTQLKNQNDMDTSIPFIDLDSVPWAANDICELHAKGVISGKSKMKFEPDSNVTREEFIKMVVVALDIKAENAPKCDFEDVMENDWFKQYVAIAVDRGIINGVTEQFFGSGLNITRQDMAVILSRAAEKSGIVLSGNKKNFNDAEKIADYAKTAVDALSSAGIINGNENGSFMPISNATRAEAAKMINSLLKLK